jgi:hypothetical protein
VIGQSGSGKTTTAVVAASICCDSTADCTITDQRDRFLRGYADASLRCSFAVYDEADKTQLPASELKSRLLDFTDNKNFHRLFVGTQQIKTPAVVYMTGTTLPPALAADEQIARRFALIDLGPGRLGANAASWRKTCGCDSAADWRSADPRNAEVSDMLVSQVIRENFDGWGPGRTFEELVRRYGFKMLSDYTANADDDLRRFHAEVMSAPEWTGGSYWKEPDWRVFDKDGGGPAMQLYRDLTDSGADVQPLTAANWSRILNLPGTVLTVRPHGKRIGFRFWQRPVKAV